MCKNVSLQLLQFFIEPLTVYNTLSEANFLNKILKQFQNIFELVNSLPNSQNLLTLNKVFGSIDTIQLKLSLF